MVEDLFSGVTHLFKPPYPRRAGRLLENYWRLRSSGQKLGGPARLAELRPSRVGLCVFYLVKNAVNTPLESFTGHYVGMLTGRIIRPTTRVQSLDCLTSMPFGKAFFGKSFRTLFEILGPGQSGKQ